MTTDHTIERRLASTKAVLRYSLKRSLMRDAFLLITVCVPIASMEAQNTGAITGRVTTAEGAPIVDVLLSLDGAGIQRRVRSTEDGSFAIRGLLPGKYDFRASRIGYKPNPMVITIADTTIAKTIVLERLAIVLETVPVVARRTGIFGTVVAATTYGPLESARISVLGGAQRHTVTNKGGGFFLDDVRPGTYLLKIEHEGYASRLLSLTVPADEATEVAVTLDAGDKGREKRLAMPLKDLEWRSRWRGNNSAVIPRAELVYGPAESLGDALRYSRSYLTKGLLLDDAIACVYVDGAPRPGWTANNVDVSEVEAVEVYGLRADFTNTLVERWPKGEPCGNGGRPKHNCTYGNSGRPVGLQSGSSSARVRADQCVRAIVVWTKSGG